MLSSSSFERENFNDMFKKNKHQSEITLVTKTEIEDPETVKKEGIRRSRDRVMIKGKDLLKSERLRKQD